MGYWPHDPYPKYRKNEVRPYKEYWPAQLIPLILARNVEAIREGRGRKDRSGKVTQALVSMGVLPGPRHRKY